MDPVTAYEKPLTNFNRYAYAFNNPYKFTDPDGRDGSNFYTDPNLRMAQPSSEGLGTVVGLVADFTPIVGDAKGIYEAYQSPTVGNVVAAVVGFIPVVGDAAGKAIKHGDDLFDAAKAAGGVERGNGDVVLAEGREAAKKMFREADVSGKGNRVIRRDQTGGGRQVVGRTADGKTMTIRYKRDGTTRIQPEHQKRKVIFEGK